MTLEEIRRLKVESELRIANVLWEEFNALHKTTGVPVRGLNIELTGHYSTRTGTQTLDQTVISECTIDLGSI